MPLAPLSPLRHRDFALVWSAALVSNVGSWMQTVAVGVLVTLHTGQARWTGLVAAAAFLPMGLLSPVGGAMADRHDRRRWLLLTTVGETVFAGILTALAATGNAGPVWVTLAVLGGGAMTAIGLPAYQALLPDLVGPDDLLGAISLSSAQWNLGRVIGPALAGVRFRHRRGCPGCQRRPVRPAARAECERRFAYEREFTFTFRLCQAEG